MFKLNPKPTFTGTALIAVPGGPAEKLKLVFKHKTRDESADFFSRAAKSEDPEAKTLLEIVAGWEDVDAEFSQENLAQLLQNYHNAVPAIFEAYTTELSTARKGN